MCGCFGAPMRPLMVGNGRPDVSHENKDAEETVVFWMFVWAFWGSDWAPDGWEW